MIINTPQIPTIDPSLSSNSSPHSIVGSLAALCHGAIAVRIATAYVVDSGAEALVRTLSEVDLPPCKVVLIAGLDFGITTPSALATLASAGVTVRIYSVSRTYHPKIYLALKPDAVEVLVGSANLSRAALQTSVEAALHVTVRTHAPLAADLMDFFDDIEADSKPLTDDFLAQYTATWVPSAQSNSGDDPQRFGRLSSSPHRPLGHSGGPPPPDGTLCGRSQDDMLLFAAWVHGMKEEQAASRLSMFSYVQTHVAPKSEEALQRAIEKSKNWRGDHRSGDYFLTSHGYSRMIQLFGPSPSPLPTNDSYEFTKTVRGHSVRVRVAEKTYKVSVDGRDKKGTDACTFLETQGVRFDGTVRRPRTILLWMLRDDFAWRRLPQWRL
jgi:HKD family nuclease